MEKASSGQLQRLTLLYDPRRQPIILARATTPVSLAQPQAVPSDVARQISSGSIVFEMQVNREELDEDAWMAVHLIQAWLLKKAGGWLYAPGDGLYDRNLLRLP